MSSYPQQPRHSDAGTPDGWFQSANHVHVTRLDIPFVNLTWFFVKASLAAALAFSVTSWLWVVIGTGVVTLSAALLLALGVPGWLAPPTPPVAPAVAPGTPSVTVVAPPPPAPVPPEIVAPAQATAEVPEPEGAPGESDPNAAATEAMLRQQLEELRRKRK
jgi:hypothetical protein